MKIKAFGYLREITGDTLELNENLCLRDFRKRLEEEFPTLKEKDFAIAVNEEIITKEEFEITEEAEVALLPPFSGG